MDEKRKGEIAYKLLRFELQQDGIQLGPNQKRRLGNIAKSTGIPLAELKEFGKEISQELLEETYK